MVCDTGAVGGAETVFWEHVKALKSAYEVTVFFQMDGGPIAEKIRAMEDVKTIIKPLFLDLHLIRYRYVYLVQVIPDLAFIKKTSPKTKMTFIFHDALLWVEIMRKRQVDLSLLDAVFCISDAIRDKLLDTFHELQKDRLHVLHNSVQHFKEDGWSPSKQMPVKTNDKIVFGFAGRISPEKNLIGLLESFRQLNKSVPHASLIIAGDIPFATETNLSIKSSIIEASKSLDCISYIGRKENLQEFYERIDFLVLTSFVEGVSVAAIDALAFGKPVISTDVGAMKELITDHVNGFLYPLEFERADPFHNATDTFTHNESKAFSKCMQEAIATSWDHAQISRMTLEKHGRTQVRSRLHTIVGNLMNQPLRHGT